MVNIQGSTITLTRGDTLRVSLELTDHTGNIYTPNEGDHIRFAMKRKYNDAEPLILKTIPNDTLILEIEPQETKSLPCVEYVYDIEMTYANGDVDTFINKAKLQLTEEVY
jgi:hypothetical protein